LDRGVKGKTFELVSRTAVRSILGGRHGGCFSQRVKGRRTAQVCVYIGEEAWTKEGRAKKVPLKHAHRKSSWIMIGV